MLVGGVLRTPGVTTRGGSMKIKLSVTAFAVVVAAVVVAAAFGAFTHAGSRAAAKAAPANPNKVGVKVHGHWTLQVRSPSGRVVRTYRFHNDLASPFAQGQLTQNLTAGVTTGPWQVLLQGSPSPCQISTFTGQSCGIAEVGAEPAGFQGDNTFNLTKSNITNGFRLRGSVVVDNDGTITTVHTYLSHCVSSVAAADCHGDSGWGRITQRVLPTIV